MGKIVYIIGDSGTGKSTSLRNLDPTSTYIINVCNKDLPFRGSANKYKVKSEDTKGNLYISNDPVRILQCIEHIANTREDIKNLIIDDFGYMISRQVMDSASQKGFDKWVNFAKSVDSILEKIQLVRSDLYVFMMWHTQLVDDGKYKIQTAGKMIDNTIKPEGKPAIIFHTIVKDNKFYFLTQNDGTHLAKSPMGMFDGLLIDNDLKPIIEKMHDYYNSKEE